MCNWAAISRSLGAAILGRERLDCLFHRASFAAQLAGTPVECAQAVENGATDTKLRVTAELNLLGWIELAKGVKQADDSGTVEIFYGNVLRQSFVDAAGDEPDDREMIDHQPLLIGGEQITRL